MSKRKLLLADDSITIQKVVNLTFADEGIEVITVGDGDAAMKKFVEVMPDLVMADVNIPGVDGYRICEMIKQDDETRQIPVILLVGSFEPFDEEEARRVGADDYLTKPFQSIRQLVNKVTDLLNSSNGEEPANIEETAQSDSGKTSVPVFTETAVQLGDAGMDDEMIQTNQIGSMPVDEPQKFESDSTEQSFEDVLPTMPRNPYQSDFGTSTGYESEDDAAKTQPLTTREFIEITAPSAEDETALSEEKIYESADEQNFEQAETTNESEIVEPEISDNQPVFEPEEVAERQFSEPETVNEDEQIIFQEGTFIPLTETSETLPVTEAASVIDFDDMDLLELPTGEKEVSSHFQAAPVEPEEHKTPVEKQAAETSETTETKPNDFEEDFETMHDSAELINLSPESIEAIAERVADLVIKKWVQQTSDNEN